MASEQAAELRKQTSEPGYYNLEAGPVSLRFQGETGIELNDNVNFTETNRQADMAFRAGVDARANWPVTEQNNLFLSTGIGYVTYLKTHDLDHLYITPDSALSFQLYTGDFTINLHERFSVTENVAQAPSVSGTGNLVQYENTPGFEVDWDLYKLILSFGYDHDMVWTTSSSYEALNHTSELFFLRAAFAPHPTTTAGVELGGGLTTYDQNIFNNSTHFSIGPFYQAQLSQHFNAKLSAGFVDYFFSPTGTTGSTNDQLSGFEGYYADLTFAHHVNRWFDHSLSVGRQIQLGTSSELLDLYYARYTANWNLIREVPISTHIFYEHGEDSGGNAEVFDRYGAGLGLSYKITQKLGGSCSYDFLLKNSDLPGYNYIQNRLVFGFTYSF